MTRQPEQVEFPEAPFTMEEFMRKNSVHGVPKFNDRQARYQLRQHGYTRVKQSKGGYKWKRGA